MKIALFGGTGRVGRAFLIGLQKTADIPSTLLSAQSIQICRIHAAGRFRETQETRMTFKL